MKKLAINVIVIFGLIYALFGMFTVRTIIFGVLLNIYCGISNIFMDGTLLIDTSNPEKDLYLFEVDDLDNINNKRKIVLKVKVKDGRDK